jgi:hypothetical protein
MDTTGGLVVNWIIYALRGISAAYFTRSLKSLWILPGQFVMTGVGSWYNKKKKVSGVERGGMTDEKIAVGQTCKSASGNLDAVRLFRAGRR